MINMLVFTKSQRVSMLFKRLFQSLVPSSLMIYLNSSINIGSIGLATRLFYFLKVLEVLLKPPLLEAPPTELFRKVCYMLKSEDYVYFPKPSLPAAVICGFYPLNAPALRVSKELFLILDP